MRTSSCFFLTDFLLFLEVLDLFEEALSSVDEYSESVAVSSKNPDFKNPFLCFPRTLPVTRVLNGFFSERFGTI